MSDTLFGHFCWALFYHKGEQSLKTLLNCYADGKPAPVLFSSAFFSGYLPRPTLPPPNRSKLRNIAAEHFGTGKKSVYEGLSRIKQWNNIRCITLELWTELKSNYSEEALYRYFAAGKTGNIVPQQETEIAAANVIDRISGAVAEEGGLFHREKIWTHHDVSLDLYVEIGDPDMESEMDWFLTEYLTDFGYGADKSVGMGNLTVRKDTDFDPQVFHVENANARLSLSLASFEGIHKIQAFYLLKTKFGKLGGNFAITGPNGGNPKPFKKPILMYEPGAVFLCSEPLNHMPLLNNVHSDDRIRHCGIPITLPFTICEDGKNEDSPS
jgi:CRISPR-associated protein Csm4